ncbi:MAG: DUF5691 domain-containing protein [Acidimicrobiales bacterium]
MRVNWDELVSTALIGTERRPFGVEQFASVTGDVHIEIEGAEAAVLAGAAVLGAYRRAGRPPDHRHAAVPAPAPPDDRPVCSDTAAQLLGLVLDGTIQAVGSRDDVVAGWLAACVRAGQRPPERLFVTLLDLGTSRPPLRPAIVTATGPRGTWLGTANSDWRWAAALAPDAPATDRWTIGTRAERVALLRTLRAADPAGARDLLQSTWATDPAAERAAFLDTFEPASDEADEAFLEQALDDRASSVRAVAARVLDRLPQSRRAERMSDRARLLVQREGRSRPKLAVTLPGDLDPSTRRDGITDTREPGKGLRAGWLTQIMAATPLGLWEGHLDADPAEVVKLARDEPEVLEGWRQAAARQGDARWAAALLDRSLDPALLAVLPPADAARRLDDALGSRSTPDPVLLDAMAAVPGPWPLALSHHAIDRMRKTSDLIVPIAIEVLAGRADPSVLPAVEDWITHAPLEGLKRQLRLLAHALSIRLTIDREFA